MYSKYLKQFLNKEVTVQIKSGDDDLMFPNCLLSYIDENILVISLPKYDKKYIFDTDTVKIIGIGNFSALGDPVVKDGQPPEGYA